MHFEILVEDQSGKKALETLVPKLITDDHTFAVHSYKGIGRIPKTMKDERDPAKRILLDNLPRLLKGYGRTFTGYGEEYKAAVLVVCDLDRRDRDVFSQELNAILAACTPRPEARFCLAIEEGEAWLLGDLPAIKTAYPYADENVLNSYHNDSICGTWQLLADAVYPGGSAKLSQRGWQAAGAEKSKWASDITPHMNVENNKSPSFQYFRDEIRLLATGN